MQVSPVFFDGLFYRRASESRRLIFHFQAIATIAAVLLLSHSVAAQNVTADSVDFNRDVRPILAENCFSCHGPDASHRATDLRLDQAEGIAAAIIPHDPAESELYDRVISTDDSIRMPPPETKKELTPDQLDLLKRWIEQGGHFQAHWSFVTPTKPELPQLKSSAIPSAANLSQNPVDLIIEQALQRRGLNFSPEADKRTLIRRVAFSLTGLPPTPEAVAQFLADDSTNAYPAMVDRYLESSRYGEEMARHWLDLARYGDTHGMHLDNERQMWAYRDWVVRSFNRNQPFDQFTIEQLAGDLLPEPTTDQWIATGFNRCNVTTGEGGAIDEEFRFRYAVDRINTAMQIWTGLTAECAACHDHKFDPISQKEYYSLYAFFNSAADPAMDGNAMLTAPVISTATEEQTNQVNEFRGRIAEHQQLLDDLVAKYDYRDPASASPAPQPVPTEAVLFDDEFPSFGKLVHAGEPTQLVTQAEDQAPVFSGQRALKRQDAGLAQDVFQESSQPFTVPQNGKIAAAVWLESTDLPLAIMLQFFKDGWNHRAVWGNYDVINWGAPNTTERVHIGELPESGRWVKLAFDASQVGLQPGDQIKGFAFTQFGGTVFWDRLAITGTSDPAQDPTRSFRAWWLKHQANPPASIPDDLKSILRKPLADDDTPTSHPAQGTDVEATQISLLSPASDDNVATKDATASDQELRKLLNYWLRHVSVEAKAHFAEPVRVIESLQAELAKFEQAIPQTFIYRDLPKTRQSFVMKRGQYNEPGETVSPAVPSFLPPLIAANPQHPTRLDFAKWLLSPNHPLTSRVIVNRFWQQFFGTGVVKSSGDFGSQGEIPSHPELLDWLAVSFRESGWDVKGLVRLLLTSHTFRQQTVVLPGMLEIDPENRLLARGPRMRLGAEQIRDNALFVSGLINLEQGGRGVKPYQPPNVWEPVGYIDSNTRNYKQDSGPALYRRSLYIFFKRTAPPPFMTNFDGPNREQICTKRDQSNTPLQALQLMNDVQHVEAARALAERMLLHSPEFAEQIKFAYQVVLSRPPQDSEVGVLNSLSEQLRDRYRASPDEARQLISVGESLPNPKLDPAELATLTLVANTLLNLDETVNRN